MLLLITKRPQTISSYEKIIRLCNFARGNEFIEVFSEKSCRPKIAKLETIALPQRTTGLKFPCNLKIEAFPVMPIEAITQIEADAEWQMASQCL